MTNFALDSIFLEKPVVFPVFSDPLTMFLRRASISNAAAVRQFAKREGEWAKWLRCAEETVLYSREKAQPRCALVDGASSSESRSRQGEWNMIVGVIG